MTIHTEDSPADIAIVGLGPAGLAAAVRAAQLGQQVIAFTNRDQYVRQQRVNLKDKSFVHKLIEEDKERIDLKDMDTLTDDEKRDLKFYTRFENEMTVQIKDVENYLYRKLRQFPNVEIVQVSHTLPISRIGTTPKCNYIEQGNSSKTRYHCHNILAADGTKHAIADQVAEDLGQDISFTTSLFKPKHQYHASIQLQKISPSIYASNLLKRKLQAQTAGLDKDIEEKNITIQDMQWDASYDPQNYIFTNDPETKFCFTGEIPQAIFDESDPRIRKNKLKQWACIFIQEKFNIGMDEIEFKNYSLEGLTTEKKDKYEKKAQMQATVFKIDGFRFCDKPLVELTNGVFACIGDARRTPYYRMAHGMGDGIELGVQFVESIGASTFDKQRYLDVIKIIDNDIDDLLKISEEIEQISPRRIYNTQNEFTVLIANIKHWLTPLTIQHMNHEVDAQLAKITLLAQSIIGIQDVESLNAILNELLETIHIIHKNTSIKTPDNLDAIALEAIFDTLSKQALEIKTCELVEQIKHALPLANNP